MEDKSDDALLILLHDVEHRQYEGHLVDVVSRYPLVSPILAHRLDIACELPASLLDPDVRASSRYSFKADPPAMMSFSLGTRLRATIKDFVVAKSIAQRATA